MAFEICHGTPLAKLSKAERNLAFVCLRVCVCGHACKRVFMHMHVCVIFNVFSSLKTHDFIKVNLLFNTVPRVFHTLYTFSGVLLFSFNPVLSNPCIAMHHVKWGIHCIQQRVLADRDLLAIRRYLFTCCEASPSSHYGLTWTSIAILLVQVCIDSWVQAQEQGLDSADASTAKLPLFLSCSFQSLPAVPLSITYHALSTSSLAGLPTCTGTWRKALIPLACAA